MQDDNWYLNQKHLHYIKKADFERDLNTRNISKKSIVFIDEGRQIWTHGKFYQCDNQNWDTVTTFFKNLNFEPYVHEDGSTTYTLKGKDAGGNDFSTNASFTILKDIFIEDAELINNGKTLKVTLNNGQVIYIDLTQLLQFQDFVSTDSIEFVLTPDPEDPQKNTIITAYARQLQSATNENVKVIAGDNGVIITGNNSSVTVGDDINIESTDGEITIINGSSSVSIEDGNISVESEDINLEATSGNVTITNEDSSVVVGSSNIFIESGSVDIQSTDGDVNITASEGNSVKINSPLYLSEDHPDVEQKLIDLQRQIDEGGGGGGGSYSAGNGIVIRDNVISIDSNDYFEPSQYWD